MILIGLICFLSGVKTDSIVLYMSGIYLGLGLLLRYTVPSHHRKGMQLVKKQDYTGAIPLFEASYAFFTRKSWIDEYRYVTLLSSSRMCYREMALCNIAFCYSQTGEGQRATEYYNQTIMAYPENGIAQSALRMLNSVGK
ncbi:tetratricopeptide repeat protein [Hymenobacter sp. PAMC 26628]|uniref:tetratricopeptide repeat protein n=1 Tax=Hymenobacter sp. PAMC 26628 TaxID=1484118 RepID=UPI0012FFC9F8|nr:hypothetical protein [Hymenobacter sp. PAMC 26628]